MSKTTSLGMAVVAASLALAGCVTPGGGVINTGTAPTAATGAAGGATSVNANASLERCDAPLGTLAVDDGRGKEWYASFGAATKITTIEPLIRLAVQQSNCFVITSIGNNRTESKLSAITDKQRNSGEFRAGSRQQKGQRVAADYYMEPAIIIDNDSTGQLAAGVGSLFGNVGALVGGAMQSKASVVTLTMFDIRSGVQVSISEGNSTATNFGAALGAFGGSTAGGLGGFSRTPEGKATVAAFMDAYNNMVVSLRNYKAQEVKGGLGRGGRLKVGS
ncbi:penicillin-binding protein activator LpoB [Cupriavidus sp. AU9028]|uniref:penicillin-binding protein activator LpoB n=1 Tax=Cupriavidus sp. AU9028 TaxID=2871157 RepID=UPI001C965212|nr:penicillin-binding protein activator LpoB [Cupriavidus sp. AU9028]MBY4897117.1 penicillin-binding protein activator LpoB [Cupriavidus sp. AU9028]